MLDVAIAYPDSPGDVGELRAWLRQLPVDQVRRLVILGKTEGPATLNDFSRDLALAATDAAIGSQSQDLLQRTVRIFSTGCEGIASPVTLMMAEVARSQGNADAVGLVVGTARSEPLPPSPRCDRNHVLVAASAVEQAVAGAGLTPDQVSFVLIKSPVFTAQDGAKSRHVGSTGSSRGAAALGAGIALGDVDANDLSDDPVGRDHLFASRVMSFSGVETDCVEVIVFGERSGGDPTWGVSASSIADFLDIDGMAHFRTLVGPAPELVFFKAGIAADGRLGGRRTTILTSELPADKQLRAAASGFMAAHFGSTPVFVSGGTEHQISGGGCICAALYRKRQ
jgi:cyanuric acid amidohydrolase